MARALEGYINKKNNVVITMLTNTRVKYMLVIVLKKIYSVHVFLLQLFNLCRFELKTKM